MSAPVPDLGRVLVIAVDRSVIGHAEISVAAALASVVRQGRTLSVKQQRSAHRILTRYTEQLAAIGVTVPDLTVPPVPAAAKGKPSSSRAPIVRVQWIVFNEGKKDEKREMRLSVAQHSFGVTDRLKAIPGARGQKKDGVFIWHYPVSPAGAAAVLDLLVGYDPQCSPKVVELARDFHGRQNARAVLDKSAPLPTFDQAPLVLDGINLWDHQRRAAQYAMNMVASLHAIPMGGGKTLATIATVNRVVREVEQIGGTTRVVILCPNAVRGVWPNEVALFSRKRWHIVNGRKPSKRSRRGFVDISGAGNRLAEAEACLFDCQCGAEVHAAVVNYDVMARAPWNTWVPRVALDVAVYDEAHKLKAQDGVVSKVVARWTAWTGKRIALSGTPIPQSPLDIFGLYRALDPGVFGTAFSRFRSRYAVTNPHIPQQVTGFQNVEELAEKFHSLCYWPTVELDLPPVTDVTRQCVLEPAALKVYTSLDDELWADLSAFATKSPGVIGHDVEQLSDIDPDEYGAYGAYDGSHAITPANVMVKLLRLQQLTGGTVIDDEGNRVVVSKAKADLLGEVLDEVGCSRRDGADPEPVIVFCRFRSDLDVVERAAAQAGLTYGEVSGRRKTGLNSKSKMAEFDVVGVQIQSGGTGVDFTRSRVGVWYSLGYSLADYDQARKRMDRPGQERPVLFVHLLAEGTADYDVYGALDSRRSVISAVVAAHELDPAKLGFAALDPIAAEDSGRDRVRGEDNAVELPFAHLIKVERARLGAPQGDWKNTDF